MSMATSTASGGGSAGSPLSRARRSTFESGWPSTHSMARKYSPSTSPKSKICAMLPCDSPSAMRASLMNMDTNALSSA
ncbi:hypothetical protein COSO111634_38445 [Corallococcus soli]